MKCVDCDEELVDDGWYIEDVGVVCSGCAPIYENWSYTPVPIFT